MDAYAESATNFTDDQAAKCTLISPAGDSWFGVSVRASGNGSTFKHYTWQVNNQVCELYYETEAGGTLLDDHNVGATVNSIYMEIRGSTLLCYANGTQVVSYSHNTITTGQPGIVTYGPTLTGTRIDDATFEDFPVEGATPVLPQFVGVIPRSVVKNIVSGVCDQPK